MIQVKCEAPFKIKLEDMTPFQGSLKSMTDKNYEKLKNEIVKHGFAVPFFLWHDKQAGKHYILDGHQRYIVLHELLDEGVELPSEWPAVRIEATDAKDARRKLLTITSQYGTVSKKGLLELVEDDWDEGALESFMSLDAIKLEPIRMDPIKSPTDPPEASGGSKGKGGAPQAQGEAPEASGEGAAASSQGDEYTRVSCPVCRHEFEVRV